MTTPNKDPLEERVASLFKHGRPKKAIARKLGINVKKVRKILEQAGLSEPQTPPPARKLDPYHQIIEDMLAKGLNNERILRELRSSGYLGGRTILGDFIRSIRSSAKSKPKRFRRFETAPAQEAQVDWSPYRVVIGQTEQVVHCFAMILGFSRRLFIQMHRDEKLPTLLQAHADAFHFFGGACARVVYDNMSTITLGRRRREILWNPRFLDFARHWMFEPVLCRPRDPNRKGKIESVFSFVFNSLLKGRRFSSWEELDQESSRWLREVANSRVHGTTHRVPEQLWLQERPLLTPPPQIPFPTYRQEVRSVYHDGTISVNGILYSVPSDLARQTVSVRIFPRHIEILDARGQVRTKHRIPDRPAKIVIDPDHYQNIKRSPCPPRGQVRDRFLSLFPSAEAFLDGLQKRMKSFYPIHLQKIERLVDTYNLENTRQAIELATRYRNFNANAIERILQQRHPLLAADPPATGLWLSQPAHQARRRRLRFPRGLRPPHKRRPPSPRGSNTRRPAQPPTP